MHCDCTHSYILAIHIHAMATLWVFILTLATFSTVSCVEDHLTANETADPDEWITHVAGASRCQLTFTSQYGYRQFFLLDKATVPKEAIRTYVGSLPSTNSSNATEDSEGYIKLLHFQVKTPSNAHVLLSPKRRADMEGYEIVLGAGSNSYSEIRHLPPLRIPSRIFNYTTSVVSDDELRQFWILADSKSGLISVGRVGEPPVLTWIDPDPIPIKYFSFSTWTDIHGVWLYGCDRNITKLESEIPTSPLERIIERVVEPRKGRHPQPWEINARLEIRHVLFKERDSIASLYGSLHLEWEDEKLSWLAEEFNETSTVIIPSTEISLPELRLLEPPDLDAVGSLRKPKHVTLKNSGIVEGSAFVRLRGRCVLVLGVTWTRPEYTCTLHVVGRSPVHLHLRTSPVHHLPDWECLVNVSEDFPDDQETARLGLLLQLRFKKRTSSINGMFIALYTGAIVMNSLWLVCPLLSYLTLPLVGMTLLALSECVPPAADAPDALHMLLGALAICGTSLLLRTFLFLVNKYSCPTILSVCVNNKMTKVLLRQSQYIAWPQLDDCLKGDSPNDWQRLWECLDKLCALSCLVLLATTLFLGK